MRSHRRIEVPLVLVAEAMLHVHDGGGRPADALAAGAKKADQALSEG